MKHILQLISAGLVTACATVSTNLPSIDPTALKQEQLKQEKALFVAMEKRGEQLNRIASKILSNNAELCDKTRPEIGVTTQSLKSYPKTMREAAGREMKLGNEPSIVYIRSGSPAAKVGLKIGDKILSAKSKALHAPSAQLSRALTPGAKLRVKRGDDTLGLPIKPDTVCDYPIKLKMNADINAYANGRHIIVTAGLIDFVKSDDELAYIVGHELAHDNLDHIRKSITNYILSLFQTRYTRPFETEADYAGLYYMVRAGYNPENVEDFWRRLGTVSPRSIHRAKTHPTFPARTIAIEAARLEIRAKQDKKLPLIPEPKTKTAVKDSAPS